MTEISRSASFGKLNSLAYKAIEGATVFCKLRGNPYVELVHWMQQILQTPDSDLHRIVRHFELDSSRLAKDVTDALDRLSRRGIDDADHDVVHGLAAADESDVAVGVLGRRIRQRRR
mgnify:CR=1 FL=1